MCCLWLHHHAMPTTRLLIIIMSCPPQYCLSSPCHAYHNNNVSGGGLSTNPKPSMSKTTVWATSPHVSHQNSCPAPQIVESSGEFHWVFVCVCLRVGGGEGVGYNQYTWLIYEPLPKRMRWGWNCFIMTATIGRPTRQQLITKCITWWEALRPHRH